MRWYAARRRGPCVDGRRRELVDGGDPGLERDVLALDLLRQLRQIHLDGGLDRDVFVLGVRDEELEDTVHVSGEIVTGRAVGCVDLARGRGHGEELGANPLVDVAVEVEPDRPDRLQDLLFDDTHDGSSVGACAGRRFRPHPQLSRRSCASPPAARLKEP